MNGILVRRVYLVGGRPLLLVTPLLVLDRLEIL